MLSKRNLTRKYPAIALDPRLPPSHSDFGPQIVTLGIAKLKKNTVHGFNLGVHSDKEMVGGPLRSLFARNSPDSDPSLTLEASAQSLARRQVLFLIFSAEALNESVLRAHFTAFVSYQKLDEHVQRIRRLVPSLY